MAKLASNSILETSLELDSHADTTVLGGDALIFQNYDRPVEVLGYNPTMGARTYQTVSGALAFDHPMTGQTYLLVFHQAISMPQLDHHLLCPMQCRVNDVIVNDVPKFLTLNPTDNTHAIVVQDPDDPAQHFCFPLNIQGVTSYLTVRKPTLAEWDSGDILHINMTAE
jgi:hypothetical protein